MGGSGGGGYIPPSRAQMQELIQQSTDSSNQEAFNTDLNNFLKKLLKRFNDRNTDFVNNELEKIKKLLSDISDEQINTLFGGSVSKNTFINGLSDIDSLLVIKDANGKSPKELLSSICDKLKEKGLDASAGDLAVTIKYSNGTEIQLLPAIKTGSKIQISSNDGKTWSAIDTNAFTNKLTKVNKDCNGMVVPVIKLAKFINSTYPQKCQLSGYHVESLAINAFKGYQGNYTFKDMLSHFFKSSALGVKAPIKDSTGQSIHVDDYLGATNSTERQNIGHLLNRTSKRIESANASSSLSDWKEFFEED